MAMNFQAAAQRVRGLLAPTRAASLSASALTPDALRDNVIRETIERNDRLQSAVSRRPVVEYGDGQEHVWENFGDCLTDYARAAFGFDEPKVRPAGEVRPSHQLERAIIEEILRCPEFHDARPYTRANQLEATMAALTVADQLQDFASMLLTDHVKRSEQMGTEEHLQASADDMFDRLREQARQEIDDVGAVQDDTRRAIKRALKQSEQAGQRLGQLIAEEDASSMRQDARTAARTAAKVALDEAQSVGEMPGFLKGTGDGAGKKLNPEQQLELAKRWTSNAHLRQLAKLLGRRLRRMARARRSRLTSSRGVKVGVETGDDLHKLLSRELARACSPVKAMRTLFVKDLVERQTMQFRTEQEIPTAKGPIIPVVDCSASMDGEPRVWAGSLEIGLLSIAAEEGRAFASVHFSSANQQKSWVFPKGEIDPHAVVDMAEHFFNGGTSILSAMRAALEIVRTQPGFKTADVVLLTDGLDHFADGDKAVRDELRAMGVRIQGISILKPNNAYCKQMCDAYIDVTQLAQDTRDQALEQVAVNLT